MADLKETDEEVGKAKGLIRGGSKRTFRAVARRGKNADGPTGNEWGKRGRELSPKSRVRNAANYLAGRFKGGYRPGSSRKFSDIRSGVYKANEADPISTLYAEIEKARSAFSGGSSKAFNRVGRIGIKAIKDGDTSRFSRASAAQRYLARRKRNAFRGGENWRTSLPKLRGGKYK